MASDPFLLPPLTRRRLLRQGISVGVGVPLAGGVLAACMSDDEDDPTTTTADRARGGMLTAAMGSEIRGFDVQRFYDTQSVTMADLVYSRLLRLDPGDASKLLPDLATEVPTPEDGGRSWTFTLREDARFHDGSPVTAADVKFSIERLISPDTKSEGVAYYTGLISDTEALAAGKRSESRGIVAVDDRTVRFRLVGPRADFAALMSIWLASIYPRSAARAGGSVNEKPVGSGPFKVDSYRPGREIRFSRHAAYHLADEVFLDGIQLQLAVDPDTAILQIDGGQLHVLTDDVPAAAYGSKRNDPKRKEQLTEGLVDDVYYLTLNDVEGTPLFESAELRRAIHMAIDKDRIVQQLQGRGEPADGFWSPKSRYHDPDFPSIPHDPDEARRVLADGGMDGQSVELIVPSSGSALSELGPSILQDLEGVGLRPELRSLEFAAWLGETMKSGAIVPNGWPMDVPHGSFVVNSALTQATKELAEADGTCCNFSRWASPEVDRLNNKGIATTDQAEDVAAYQEIMRMTMGQEALWIPLVWPKRVYYHAPAVQGVTVSTNTAALLLSRLSLNA